MTKLELIDEVTRRLRKRGVRVPGLRRIVRPVVDVALEVIAEVAGTGEPVSLCGFGKLHTVTKASQKAYDFKAGRTITLPPREKIVFTPFAGFWRR